jgi:mRNA interferase HigB
MHVIAVKALREFWERHPDAEGSLRAWYDEARRARWQSAQDIRARYAHASFVGTERVIFNIGGNKYRLIAVVRCRTATIFVRFVGTHADYDRIDARTI